MAHDCSTLTRAQIKRVFARNRGAQQQLADHLGLDQSTVSKWLKGEGKSARIADAAQKMAVQLLQEENVHAA